MSELAQAPRSVVEGEEIPLGNAAEGVPLLHRLAEGAGDLGGQFLHVLLQETIYGPIDAFNLVRRPIAIDMDEVAEISPCALEAHLAYDVKPFDDVG